METYVNLPVNLMIPSLTMEHAIRKRKKKKRNVIRKKTMFVLVTTKHTQMHAL